MLKSYLVSIVVLGMIALSLRFFKNRKKTYIFQQKMAIRDSSGGHGGYTQKLLSSKIATSSYYFLIEKILHLAWTKSFSRLWCMICPWETNM